MWPTILFLHGSDESGKDPNLVMQQGLPRLLANQPDFPFAVIAPQCPKYTWWPELTDELSFLLDECASKYPIDQKRLYLTGISMGGYGSWYLGVRLPNRFAAIAPICGGGYWFHGFPERVLALKDTPVWAFHGKLDDVVPWQASEELVSYLNIHGGNAKLTLYPHLGHDSWTVTYKNPKLFEWFLNHKGN